jgi:hypothetical protein
MDYIAYHIINTKLWYWNKFWNFEFLLFSLFFRIHFLELQQMMYDADKLSGKCNNRLFMTFFCFDSLLSSLSASFPIPMTARATCKACITLPNPRKDEQIPLCVKVSLNLHYQKTSDPQCDVDSNEVFNNYINIYRMCSNNII